VLVAAVGARWPMQPEARTGAFCQVHRGYEIRSVTWRSISSDTSTCHATPLHPLASMESPAVPAETENCAVSSRTGVLIKEMSFCHLPKENC
jgi:hypothetical protein